VGGFAVVAKLSAKAAVVRAAFLRTAHIGFAVTSVIWRSHFDFFFRFSTICLSALKWLGSQLIPARSIAGLDLSQTLE
jgi:hypothetical protein